jgi:hypothetical protein
MEGRVKILNQSVKKFRRYKTDVAGGAGFSRKKHFFTYYGCDM